MASSRPHTPRPTTPKASKRLSGYGFLVPLARDGKNPFLLPVSGGGGKKAPIPSGKLDEPTSEFVSRLATPRGGGRCLSSQDAPWMDKPASKQSRPLTDEAAEALVPGEPPKPTVPFRPPQFTNLEGRRMRTEEWHDASPRRSPRRDTPFNQTSAFVVHRGCRAHRAPFTDPWAAMDLAPLPPRPGSVPH